MHTYASVEHSDTYYNSWGIKSLQSGEKLLNQGLSSIGSEYICHDQGNFRLSLGMIKLLLCMKGDPFRYWSQRVGMAAALLGVVELTTAH